MADKVYREGHWFVDASLAGFLYAPAGYYEVNIEPDKTGWLYITFEQVRQLIPFLDEQGFIKPRLDERLRNEDLKITHRLLDLLDNMCARPHK
jgi:hypothetical protein